MDRPAEQEEPEHPGEAELKDRSKQTPLQQLAQPGYEEAAQRRDHIAGRTLARHSRASCEMVVGSGRGVVPYWNYETRLPWVSVRLVPPKTLV